MAEPSGREKEKEIIYNRWCAARRRRSSFSRIRESVNEPPKIHLVGKENEGRRKKKSRARVKVDGSRRAFRALNPPVHS